MRTAILALVLALALPAAGTAAPADSPPPPPHGTPGPAVTVLHLQETAEKSLVPDRLRLEMRVEQNGADPRVVQAAINQHMAAALKTARQAAGIEVETGNYAMFREEPSAAPAYWRGSQSLILTGKDATSVLKLAGELQSDGLVMSALGFEVSPEVLRGTQEDLTAEALAALDRRSAAIAERLHLRVVGYRDLTIGNAETGPPPIRLQAAMAKAMPAPVAAPGRARVELTITAELILGPPSPPRP